jgi:hypothetical protein
MGFFYIKGPQNREISKCFSSPDPLGIHFLYWTVFYLVLGRTLVYDLLNEFLFPASKIMMDSMDEAKRETALAEVSPK